MPKGLPPAKKNVLKTRKMPDGSQQYVRGKNAVERVTTAGKAVMSTKNLKAKQMLLKVQRAEMSPKARAVSAQQDENRKRIELRFGRQRAEAMKKKK
jgi:hypothetical protein